MKLNAYQILEIEPRATAEQVRQAFRAQCQRFGAKSHRGDPEATRALKAVLWAWSKLKDPAERNLYDERIGVMARDLPDADPTDVRAFWDLFRTPGLSSVLIIVNGVKFTPSG